MAAVKRLELARTGDDALDDLLGGGIPRESVVIIAGEPGSGKTVLTLQILFAAARNGQRSLFFTTLSEPALKLLRYAQQFVFFDAELFERWITFVDLGAALRRGAQHATEEIDARVAEHEPAFVAIDSFKVLGELVRQQPDGRPLIYDLAVQMAAWGATTLLVGEYARSDYGGFPEFAIADGILQLGCQRDELTSVRDVEVMKLRGAAHRPGRHFFDITAQGLKFFPRVSIPPDVQHQRAAQPTDRVATGIAGLDDALSGGFPRASSTVVEGGTGTGKTLLGLQFLITGARRGERGILFTLEETPDQLRAAAASLGWELGPLEDQGLVAIRYTSPVELSTDRYLDEARHHVRAIGARRAVFDSLTTMSIGVSSPRRFKEMVYAISKYLRGADVTLVLTSEAMESVGGGQLSGHGASFIADNFIKIRHVEIDGRLDRAISVIKARGIPHDSGFRGLTIGHGGLQVIKDRFKDLRGVLTGLPFREGRAR
jgi:circadian clock protein KaiC